MTESKRASMTELMELSAFIIAKMCLLYRACLNVQANLDANFAVDDSAWQLCGSMFKMPLEKAIAKVPLELPPPLARDFERYRRTLVAPRPMDVANLKPGDNTPVKLRRAVISLVGDATALNSAAMTLQATPEKYPFEGEHAFEALFESERNVARRMLWAIVKGTAERTETGTLKDLTAECSRVMILGGMRNREDVDGGPSGRVVAARKEAKSVGVSPSRKSISGRAERRLLAGHSKTALEELGELLRSAHANVEERSNAAWALSRWHASLGDCERALELLTACQVLAPQKRGSRKVASLEVACLTRMDRFAEARKRIAPVLQRNPNDIQLRLLSANTLFPEGDDARLREINIVFQNVQRAPISLIDSLQPLSFANIGCDTVVPAREADGPLVTVLMPAYNAAATIEFAVRSVLAQSWANLELIVVDDCSDDHTYTILQGLSRRDSRLKLLKHEKNRGAYAARNTGFAYASGDYITVQDCDDWSHPERLAQQVQVLSSNSNLVGMFCHWIRARNDLMFTGSWRAGAEFVTEDLSSLIVRRDALLEAGGWDEVRVAGDGELLNRLRVRHGENAISKSFVGFPFAFALQRDESLTRSGPAHVRTIMHGLRRDYRESAKHWYNTTPLDKLVMMREGAKRPFPAPVRMLPDGSNSIDVDFLFIMDFNLIGGSTNSTLNYIEAALATGAKVAVFHWRRYDLDPNKELDSKIRCLAAEGRVRIAVAEDDVTTKYVIVGYPVVLRYPIDRPPIIKFDHLLVIVNQMDTRLFSGGDFQYDPAEIRKYLISAFGTEGTWIPISGLVKRLMSSRRGFPQPHAEVWPPLLDLQNVKVRATSWAASARPPVVGRHGRDHYTKWPTTPEDIAAVYCVNRACSVEFLGGASQALSILGYTPDNWTVHEYGALDVVEFLQRLDFFVHFPHEDYIEEYGRAIIEAMAVGVIAILPEVFRESFGDAAVYASPNDVWPVIERLWRDEAGYLAQVERGREYVLHNSGWEHFRHRIARFEEC